MEMWARAVLDAGRIVSCGLAADKYAWCTANTSLWVALVDEQYTSWVYSTLARLHGEFANSHYVSHWIAFCKKMWRQRSLIFIYGFWSVCVMSLTLSIWKLISRLLMHEYRIYFTRICLTRGVDLCSLPINLTPTYCKKPHYCVLSSK